MTLSKDLPALLAAVFVAILFIQSGYDKLSDWGGNLSFLRQHFAQTPLRLFVVPMLATITFMESITGIAAAIGLIEYFGNGSITMMFSASILGALTLTALFFGQRLAKDYSGAAVLVPYFLLTVVLMWLTRPV